MSKEGKQFEADWKDSCVRQKIYLERFKDSAMWGKGFKNAATKNPCDFIMYSQPYLFLLEMKSTQGTSFSFDEKIIKQHQIDSLVDSQNYDGIIAGFLFNFRYRKTKKTERSNAVYFVPIDKFVEFKDSCDKSSMNEEDCRNIGMTIKGEIKISHYKYDVKDFIMCLVFDYPRKAIQGL